MSASGFARGRRRVLLHSLLSLIRLPNSPLASVHVARQELALFSKGHDS